MRRPGLSRRQALVSALTLAAARASRAESAPARWQRLAALTRGPQAVTTGLVVRLQRGGRVLAEGAWGRRRLGAHTAPMTQDTRLRIASVSKLALAVALLRLHEAGRLDLDADLGPLLGIPLRHPGFPTVPLSARLLLSHRASLRDVDLPEAPTGAALRQTLAHADSWHPAAPGQHFDYCNLGYIVLATAMEAATGQPFEALMQQWLFQPLGLRAGYDPARWPADARDHLATLYRHQGGAWRPQADAWPLPASPVPVAYQPGENAAPYAPQGGLRVSLPELARLAQLLQQGGRWQDQALLSPAGFEQLLQPHWTHRPGDGSETLDGLFRAWGLGLQRLTDTRDAEGGDRLHPRGGWRAYGHVGDAYGLLSALIFQPDRPDAPGWSLMYAFNGTRGAEGPARGQYSSFRRCEEQVLEALLDTLNAS